MIVYCQRHGRGLGVVEPHPVGGFTAFEWRTPQWRDRFAAEAGIDGRHNGFVNLREATAPTILVNGCRDCGPRELSVADLLGAFDRGRSTISL